MKYRKILIAYDNSSSAKHAAEKGVKLADILKAEIGIVMVLENQVFLNSTETSGAQVALLAKLRKDAKSTLEKLVKKIKHRSVIFLEEGEAGKEILKVAALWKADLIVMGTHGRTGIKLLVMGSVAEQVMRHSKCPLFIVPANDK